MMGGLYSSKKEAEFQGQLASVALAVEALEKILIAKKVIVDGEVMQAAGELFRAKLAAGDDYDARSD